MKRPIQLNLNKTYKLIKELKDKYSLILGEITITEEGRVISKGKSIDLFHMRGEDFHEFLRGQTEEERRTLIILSTLVRMKRREFQSCIKGFHMKEEEIDYEEKYCRLLLEFEEVMEIRRKERKANCIIDNARERRIKELENEVNKLKK